MESDGIEITAPRVENDNTNININRNDRITSMESSSCVVKRYDTEFARKCLVMHDSPITSGRMMIIWGVFSLLYISIGIHMLITNSHLSEMIINYTDCESHHNSQVKCSQMNESNPCICIIPLTIKKDIESHVVMYYQLTNFYQNSRTYSMSYDREQLLGLKSNDLYKCRPFHYREVNNESMVIGPCGAIANSIFNDTFGMNRIYDNKSESIKLQETDITWEFDKKYKFHNPNPRDNLKEAFKGVAKPLNWKKSAANLDVINHDNNGYRNEHFIVWMRISTFSKFRKLYANIGNRNDKIGLFKGNYTLKIDYNFPVKEFSGTKSIVITNLSVYGGKNFSFGIIFTITGSVMLFMAVIFLFIYLKIEKLSNRIIISHYRGLSQLWDNDYSEVRLRNDII